MSAASPVSPTSGLTIRRAEARDVEAAVPLIYSSGPEAYEFVFSHGKVDANTYLRRAFVTGRGLFGYQNHFVAEQAGQVVAAVAIYSAAEYNRYSLNVILDLPRAYPPQAWLKVISCSLKTKRWMPPPRRNMDYVANFGVAADVRGQGVGQQLLSFGLERARARGKTVYALDVAVTNPRAQALYERFGMQVVGEQVSPAPDKMPNARRMSMAVGSS